MNSFLETCKDWKVSPCTIGLCTSCVNKFHWHLKSMKCKENKQWMTKTKAKLNVTDSLLPDLPKFEGQKYTMLVKTKQCPN